MRRELEALVRLIAPPMAATPIEIRSELTPDEFEPALERVPGVLQQGKAHTEGYRARWASVEINGENADLHFRSGALRRPGGGVGRGTLYIIEAHLTGRISAATDGSVFCGGMRTLSGYADALIRILPPVLLVAVIATLVMSVTAPSLVLIPGVVLSSTVCGFLGGVVSLRWSRKQKSREIAKMLLVMNEVTASTIADVPAQPVRRLASRLLGPWLRDIPASSILEAIRRLEESPVTDQVGGQT